MKSKMMKRYERGGEVDAMETSNQSEDSPPMGKAEEAAAPEAAAPAEAPTRRRRVIEA
jgi:hypothetical protein